MEVRTGSGQRDASDILAAAALALAGLLSLVVILHHPVLHRIMDATAQARAIGSLAGIDRLVHGSLMAISGVEAVAFCAFTARLGFSRPAALAGLVSYAAGVLILIIPTTLDGFVVPDLAASCLAANACGSQRAAITLVSIAIQDFTKVALACVSVAILCWSIEVVRRPGLTCRAAGVTGLACAAGPLLVLWSSNIVLRPGNLAAIILAQVVWNLAAAALLIKRPGVADGQPLGV